MFPPERPKHEVKAEWYRVYSLYHATEDKDEKLRLSSELRQIHNELNLEVLESFQTETYGIRLTKMWGRYHVDVIMKIGNGIMRGGTFGGTENEQSARDFYNKELDEHSE